MSRLPTVGGDDDSWGNILNDFLAVEHNADGTQKSLDPAKIAGTAETQANKGVAGGYAPLDGTGKVPAGNLPATSTPDATGSTKGVIQLAGDLSGSAASPSVPGLSAKEDTANKGAASGYAPLDSSSLVPTANLPLATLDGRYTAPVLFSRSGTLSVTAGASRYPVPQAATIVGVRAAAGTAPAGAAIIIDVIKNGTTVFTTRANRPSIADGANSSAQAVPDTTSLIAGDLLSVDVDQVGSTTAGSDLTVVVLIKAS